VVNAVVTTSASSATMNEATEVRVSTHTVVTGLAGVMDICVMRVLRFPYLETTLRGRRIRLTKILPAGESFAPSGTSSRGKARLRRIERVTSGIAQMLMSALERYSNRCAKRAVSTPMRGSILTPFIASPSSRGIEFGAPSLASQGFHVPEPR
jgi:hypothetical protein